MLLLFRKPIGSCDPHPLAPYIDWQGHQTEDTHKHGEDAEGLSGATVVDPIRNEVRPSKGNNGADNGDDSEAIAADGMVGFNELFRKEGYISKHPLQAGKVLVSTHIVEADRGDLHETESKHAIAKLETNPSLWSWVLSTETED